MDGTNVDSDHSMTWEDFFGSTTDLTPTLIGIYDSFLEPAKSLRPDTSPSEKAKDARNDPPVVNMTRTTKDVAELSNVTNPSDMTNDKEPSKLPTAALNKSSLYTIRTMSEDRITSDKCEVPNERNLKYNNFQRSFRDKGESAFGNLSPNVKRMISGATETTTLKLQKKTANLGRYSLKHKSNIPLVGATSKISQSGVEILPSVEIYDQPFTMKTFGKTKSEELDSVPIQNKPEFRTNEVLTPYDVPTNNRPLIYDIPNTKNTAFESLSLPYIDSSIELSISSNDREFDVKLNSKDNSPEKPAPIISPKSSPAKIPKIVNGGTNSSPGKDFQADTLKPSKIPSLETVASAGNLKSAPEKEVPIPNPPTVEVSRPLSLSSIASSSSTSSGGVQNKGVNSAYLASIESLDDHSDLDLASANGSNAFVNNAGLNLGVGEERRSEGPLASKSADETSSLSQLERVCAEIVHTENVYVEDLRQVVEGYLHQWKREVRFSEDELAELFNNIEDIYIFNRSLCEELNSFQLDATGIARCFVNNTKGFSVYTSYCTGYPRTMERLAALASSLQSARAFRERQMALGHPLPLASYLLKPVQRILKYHLLLQNVVKHCASPETEYALLQMTGIAQHIDDMKRRHEHAVRVQEIQSLLYGWNGPDLTTYGELCAEGTFRVFGAKAMRHAFLFDKMLLVTKNREDGILAYKSHIMCNNMMLVEAIAGAPLSFHVIPWDAPRAQLTLQARSARHKREWTLLLKRVILENYNAVIPSHARQLVMELGQNKTDDDILAEKSHNLITQASMRKQLSAPEYLEKRKLERERRKTFENGIRARMKKTNRKYTLPSRIDTTQDCDCAQVSLEKGTDYTCDNCYVDLCSDCEAELNKDKSDVNCDCIDRDNDDEDKCMECDRPLQYIDAGSSEHLERNRSTCKCSDFKSSQESFGKEFPSSLNKTRGYHSSDNIVGYTEKVKSKQDLNKSIDKTCLKCSKLKKNKAITNTLSPVPTRKSRSNYGTDKRSETLRSKSRDDQQRSKLSKIGTWRRKSEPGLQQNSIIIPKKSQEDNTDKSDIRGGEKIEFECRNCGSSKINKKRGIISDPEIDSKKKGIHSKSGVEIKMYNTKIIPKKISKLKKNRTKSSRLCSDTSAKFYADLSTDVSTENILHISESNDSLHVHKNTQKSVLPDNISKDEDIDEETYKKLIEKTDSFKKNELEKCKYFNNQKIINEGSETEDKDDDEIEKRKNEEPFEEQPIEQIISQLLLQNREFQKLLKKQQLRNSAQRRHQRLLKSHSNPEEVVLAKYSETLRVKPKYTRQTSENIDLNTKNSELVTLSPPNEMNDGEDDHIYETLKVDAAVRESSNSTNSDGKEVWSKVSKHENHRSAQESDYVYLSFDKLNIQDVDGIYDVPIKSPEKIRHSSTDHYVIMANQGPPTGKKEENLYDNLVDVCRRKKETPKTLPGEYLPMNTDQQSPNTPEIWLSRQKEHFNMSRDRKSGSLPRSFQVVTNQDETDLTTFQLKPNVSSKTYLNRDGKVLSVDRPFTIASDQSELSYDDVEAYMAESDIMKYNKTSKSSGGDYSQDISQSTLELEEEIDRCYKTNFEQINLDKNKNENLFTVSQPNLNTSMTSSFEVLTEQNKQSDIEVIHPEHKIYKPTSNVLSLKNVLSRFRHRTPSKTSDENEINVNEEVCPDSMKSEVKSPSNEKRSALNPRSYSKNLLQRFRSIISDDHQDDNHKLESTKPTKSEIKVVITSTDDIPTSSTMVYSISDALSKSVFETTTLTESQNEKNRLEALSHSCDNINKKPDNHRPSYDKSISLISNVSSSIGSTVSPTKSNNSSYQSLNKLPIYMQGSKHLGARIAQADYVDPTTLKEINEKSKLKNVNVLINKNSVRPDSLFSNSSFVTSSSEGTYPENSAKANSSLNMESSMQYDKKTDSANQIISDESYYEKSFEKIEQVTDQDMFRDSAVYSDQEEVEDGRTDTSNKMTNKIANRSQSVKRESSIKARKVIVTTSTTNYKSNVQIRQSLTNSKVQQVTKPNANQEKSIPTIKSKVAPPVPVKPKITNIPSATFQNKSFVHRTSSVVKSEVLTTNDNESVNPKAIKRYASFKPTVGRSESRSVAEPTLSNSENKDVSDNATKEADDTSNSIIPQSIQMKRMSFERASLDSATRKLRTIEKRSSVEQPKTSKSVLERRMELEKLSKTQEPKPISNLKKPAQIPRPKSITTKVATFERSVSENSKKDNAQINTNIKDKHIPEIKNDVKLEESDNAITADVDPKESWVKQVVNKFQ